MRHLADLLCQVSESACKRAGVPDNQAAAFANMAVADFYLERAQYMAVSAHYAERMADQRREEKEAKQVKQLALDLQAKGKQLLEDNPS